MFSKKFKIKKDKCLGIEMIACYVDGIMPDQQRSFVEKHIAICSQCKEEIACQIEVAKLQKEEGLTFVPEYVTERAKNLISEQFGSNILEVFVNFTDKAIEVVRTTGDVLFGGQPQPVFALRSKEIAPATTQSIVKIFDNVKVEVEITRHKDDLNKVILKLKDAQTETPINDLRATLIENEIELESYITQNGKAIFENIRPHRYLIRISKVDKPIGVVVLELNRV